MYPTDKYMEKLSPSDPPLIRVFCRVSFKQGFILSKFLKRLSVFRVAGVKVFENEVEFVLSRRVNECFKLVDTMESILGGVSNYIDSVCFETYVVFKSFLEKKPMIPSASIVSIVKRGSIETCIVSIDNRLLWIYRNMNTGKVVAKLILAKVLNPTYLNPSSIPSTLFIKCFNDPKDLVVELDKLINTYRLLVNKINQ